MVSFAFAWALIPTSIAHAQSSLPDTLFYDLVAPPSAFEYGCFGPCACPILVRAPLTGSFALRRSRVDPLYTYYDVLDVRWRVPDSTKPVTITGSGTYRRGGEAALMEQLALDLSFDGGPAQHFDSGLRNPGAPFPEISTRISLHSQFCFDSALVVDAKPITATGVDGGPLTPTLVATPNPFGSSTEIAFAFAREAVVSLGVFDLSGRRVRALVSRERMVGGPYKRVWDGRRENGATAPAGLYFVRLDIDGARTSRTIAKLR